MSMRRLGRVPALLGVLAIVTAGCGAAATPTPAPTPTPTAAPTPSPTATPVDVAREFLAQILVAQTGSLTVAGTVTFGTTEAALSGTLEFSGKDSVSSLTFDTAGARQTQESIRVGAKRWKRDGAGPWVVDPKPTDPSKSLTSFLAALTALEDRGVETKGGRQLHHLVPPAGTAISPDALGLDPTIKDPVIAIDFWAEDDGTPATWTIGVSWKQPAGASTIPVELVMDVDLAGLGKAATIAAPEDAWVPFVSTRSKYSMAHPADWTVKEVGGQDQFLVDGKPVIFVAPQQLPGYTLDKLVADLVASYKTQLKASPEKDEEATLGGGPARILTYHFTNADDVKLYLVDVVALRGSTGYEVYMLVPAGTEPDDRAAFEQVLSTFEFTE